MNKILCMWKWKWKWKADISLQLPPGKMSQKTA